MILIAYIAEESIRFSEIVFMITFYLVAVVSFTCLVKLSMYLPSPSFNKKEDKNDNNPKKQS
jgi:hypothetical protein